MCTNLSIDARGVTLRAVCAFLSLDTISYSRNNYLGIILTEKPLEVNRDIALLYI
jgi:hypothetical protein